MFTICPHFMRRRRDSREVLLLAALMIAAGFLSTAGAAEDAVTLHSFCRGCADGYAPWSGMVRGPDGAFYGTTYGGGNDTPFHKATYGAGVIYRMTGDGRFSVLHAFNAEQEGAYPDAGLSVGADGNLYGTTSAGGAANRGCVFRISISGDFMVLHEFDSGDGYSAYSPPVEDAQGNWYGTTLHGGASNLGTIYEITSGGTFLTLYSFTGFSDGSDPQAGLVLAGDGNLYGSTLFGGGIASAGTIFRITPTGMLTTLHEFAVQDGGAPEQTLVIGNDAALYGTTLNGGQYGDGTVFRITLDGALGTLYSFNGPSSETGPSSALTLSADGSFYGVRATGGSGGVGAIYSITPSGSYTEMYDFTGDQPNGADPEATLALGADGALYGTTLDGGKYGGGAVFRYATRAAKASQSTHPATQPDF
jgi:uncharacterized repeat protein (TIGR03803 family)